jgi:hypothetical protein
MSVASLSKSRLERMHRVLTGYVDRQEMPGLVALVSRHDELHVETLGTLAFGNPAPTQRDTIFRIASNHQTGDCGCGNDFDGGMQAAARRVNRALDAGTCGSPRAEGHHFVAR